MLKYVLCAVTFIYSASAMADTDEFVYPNYLDDEEYEQCVKLSQSYDNCIKDESKRILRDVKILYQNFCITPNCCCTRSRFEDDIAETLYTEMGQSGCRRTPQ